MGGKYKVHLQLNPQLLIINEVKRLLLISPIYSNPTLNPRYLQILYYSDTKTPTKRP